MGRVYTVRLTRPVFQTVVMEVEAWNRKSAERKALRRAQTLPESEWADKDFDDGRYTPHIESVIENQQIYETSSNPHKEISAFRTGKTGSSAYLILEADLGKGVGRLLVQPWFKQINEVAQADLCSDWAEPVNFIIENDGLESGAGQSVSGLDLAADENVIEFPADFPDREVAES